MTIRVKTLVCCLWLSFLLAGRLFSQVQDRGPLSWMVLNGRYSLHKNMRLFAETQVRSAAIFKHYNYFELKGGGSYHIGPNFNALVGFGRYAGWQETGNFQLPLLQDEWRLWEEVALGQYVGRFRFEHRYRIEQRWLAVGFRNRFRYRLGLVLPLNRRRIADNTLYINALDEIFLGSEAPFFQRNRFVLGGGYRFTFLNVQANYLRQFDYSLSSSRARNYLQIVLLFDLGKPAEGSRDNPMPED